MASNSAMTGEVSEIEVDVGVALKKQESVIDALSKKVVQMESVLPGADEVVQKSIESVVSSLKNLSHNQQVLEAKFEDLLKNQANSDAAINDLSAEVSKISKIVAEQQQLLQNGINLDSSAGGAGTLSLSSSGGYGNISPPHRGPGRPPKKASSILANGERRAKLPFPTDHISKSKRFFVDPDKEKSSHVEDPFDHGETSNTTPQEPKKRRGRPSKKASTWDAQNASSSSASKRGHKESTPSESSSAHAPKYTTSRRKSQRIKPGSTQQYDEQSDLSSSFSGASDNETQDDDNGTAAADDSEEAAARKQKELERRRDERERMLVTMKYSDRNVTRNFMELNKDLFMAMKQEERKKRMTAIQFDNGVPLGKYQLSNKPIEPLAVSKIPFSLSQSSELQSPLPKMPESAQSTTANSGISDDHISNQPDSAGSNTNTGSSTQDNVSRGNNEGDGNHTQQSNSPSIAGSRGYSSEAPKRSSSTFDEQSKTSKDLEGPRKVKILSILNNEGSPEVKKELDSNAHQGGEIDANNSSPASADSSGIFAGNLSISYLNNNEPPRKKRLLSVNDRRKMSKMIPMLPEKKDKRGRPSSNNQSQENAASLLMSSPVELYCREGFFYRKGSTVPITAGEYLDLKFRHKEEELIKLTMHEEDYAELTRQDRINAYFLKPDVEIESSMACQVLSNVILTERYVNSLEYFLMEFRWENRLVSLGLKLRESKRTWQRRKALFALFEFWRDKSKDKRGFKNYTLLHAIKEMENYRVFINRSVSWFYNHITLLKMILFDLCDNTSTHWREWMFARGSELPIVGENGVTVTTINREIDNMLVLDFLEDGSRNSHKKSSNIPYKENSEGPPEESVEAEEKKEPVVYVQTMGGSQRDTATEEAENSKQSTEGPDESEEPQAQNTNGEEQNTEKEKQVESAANDTVTTTPAENNESKEPSQQEPLPEEHS